MYFNKVFLSSLAAMKISDHAIKAGDREICGYMTGFAKNGAFYVLDAIEIPIIGSDSRVEIAGQMGDKAHVYTTTLLELMEKVGRCQKLVGWYHSHPGFGCWLSGIDVNTQRMLQMMYKTFFALVIDPYRTLSNRYLEIGCFMCFQSDSSDNKTNFYESIPLYKAEVLYYFIMFRILVFMLVNIIN
jgi:COP9 signalosome complex subunit 5